MSRLDEFFSSARLRGKWDEASQPTEVVEVLPPAAPRAVAERLRRLASARFAAAAGDEGEVAVLQLIDRLIETLVARYPTDPDVVVVDAAALDAEIAELVDRVEDLMDAAEVRRRRP